MGGSPRALILTEVTDMRPLNSHTTTTATVKRLIYASAIGLMISTIVSAQPYVPLVTMSITTADGQTKDLTAHESGLATLRVKDGAEYGFRPTIQDSTPWSRVVVTIFKTATANARDPGAWGNRAQERRSGGGVEDEAFIQGRRSQCLGVDYHELVAASPGRLPGAASRSPRTEKTVYGCVSVEV